MLKWLLGTILGVVLGLAGFFFFSLGAYKSVEIQETNQPGLHLLYLDHSGPYHKIVTTIEKVEAFAKAEKLDCHLSFGQYLDNPQEVEEGRLRSRGGCLTREPSGYNQIAAKLPPDFKILDLPAQKWVQAVFTGSPAIGPLKVYPKVMDYFNAKGVKMGAFSLEQYEVLSPKEVTTTYLFPF